MIDCPKLIPNSRASLRHVFDIFDEFELVAVDEARGRIKVRKKPKFGEAPRCFDDSYWASIAGFYWQD